MRKQHFWLILILVIVFTSCKKNETLTPTSNLQETVDSSAVLKFSGTFTSGPYSSTSGTAEIYLQNSNYLVKISDLSTNNGPALHVFLSKEAMPINYMDLGALKSIQGNQVYSIDGNPDFRLYKYISIHCVQYNHLFGSAILN